jgi:guanylate kinase
MSLILAISGPAAVGKTTICDRLIADFGGSIHRLVTATTRKPRVSERDGVDYYFLNEEEFNKKLAQDCFLENEIIHGNKYGILKESLLDSNNDGQDILLNIDVNGASSLKLFCNENQSLQDRVKTIFIKPKSLEDLRQRIQARGSESEEQIEIRLANAQKEISRAVDFDFVFVSDDRDSDYKEVKKFYLISKNNIKL